jgi:LPXTG-motif cell wall-anchored protein
VSAVLKYGGKQLNWNGTVSINGATAAQLQAALAKAHAKKSSGFPVILVAIGLVLALLLLAAAILLRRRRRNAQVVVQPATEDQLAA